MDIEQHRQVPQPNWSTKIQCGCGFEAKSKCEWAFHVMRALGLMT